MRVIRLVSRGFQELFAVGPVQRKPHKRGEYNRNVSKYIRYGFETAAQEAQSIASRKGEQLPALFENPDRRSNVDAGREPVATTH